MCECLELVGCVCGGGGAIVVCLPACLPAYPTVLLPVHHSVSSVPELQCTRQGGTVRKEDVQSQ